MKTSTAVLIAVGGIVVLGGGYLLYQQQQAQLRALEDARRSTSQTGFLGTLQRVLGGVIGTASGASVVAGGIGGIVDSFDDFFD